MRYTEARLSNLAGEMLADFDKETVNFVANYDETLQVPSVLPSRLPNLLVNGADGIAVGMATRIPPHNLREVVQALCAMVDDPTMTTEQLMAYVVAPDFPTGGIIFGREGVREAYTTGRGRIIVRAKANIEESHKPGTRDRIVVTEIPYQVNKSRLIEKIVELIEEKKVEGIADIRDESDRDGMRLVIELKREAVPDVVLSQLFKHSPLQETFGVILLALVGGVPKVLTLRDLFEHFLEHRHEVVLRRTQFELRQARDRLHILEGLQTALDHIDEVIELIRAATSPEVAQRELMEAFSLSERQATAILEMRLQRLTGLERRKLHDEMVELRAKIQELERLMTSRDERMKLVKDELMELTEKYGDERRTQIVEETAEVNLEDLIAPEEMVVTISHAGYIKRFPVSGFRRQGRGGRGFQGARTKEEDFIQHLFVASTHDYILLFTDRGKCYWLKVYEIPQMGRGSRGKALVNLIEPLSEERVRAFVAVSDFAEGRFVMMVTRKGTVKKTSLAEFANPRKSGIIALKIESDDELLEAILTNGDSEVVIGTSRGKAVRFHESDVRPMGRTAQGVHGVGLPEGAWVVGMIVAREGGSVLTVTDRGLGKRSPFEDYRLTKRGAQGVLALKVTAKTGAMVAIMNVTDEEDLIIITEAGVIIRQSVREIREMGRITQGVRLIRLDEGDRIADIARVVSESEEENGQ
jgi:DNA gyrase subunit A